MYLSSFNPETDSTFDATKVENIKYRVQAKVDKFADKMEKAGHPFTTEDKRYRFEQEMHKEIATLTHQLVELTNTTAKDVIANGMWEGMSKSHRYLQSTFWQTMLVFMGNISNKDDRFFDGRNQHIKDICRRMVNAVFG